MDDEQEMNGLFGTVVHRRIGWSLPPGPDGQPDFEAEPASICSCGGFGGVHITPERPVHVDEVGTGVGSDLNSPGTRMMIVGFVTTLGDGTPCEEVFVLGKTQAAALYATTAASLTQMGELPPDAMKVLSVYSLDNWPLEGDEAGPR